MLLENFIGELIIQSYSLVVSLLPVSNGSIAFYCCPFSEKQLKLTLDTTERGNFRKAVTFLVHQGK